jgi:hypothetical protein
MTSQAFTALALALLLGFNVGKYVERRWPGNRNAEQQTQQLPCGVLKIEGLESVPTTTKQIVTVQQDATETAPTPEPSPSEEQKRLERENDMSTLVTRTMERLQKKRSNGEYISNSAPINLEDDVADYRFYSEAFSREGYAVSEVREAYDGSYILVYRSSAERDYWAAQRAAEEAEEERVNAEKELIRQEQLRQIQEKQNGRQ